MSAQTPEDYNRKLLQKLLQEWCQDLQVETRKDKIILSRESLQMIEASEKAVKLLTTSDDRDSATSSPLLQATLPESTARIYLIGTITRDEILPNLAAKYQKIKEVKKRTRRGRGGSWKIKIPVINEKLLERVLKSTMKTKIKYKKDDKILDDLKKMLRETRDKDDDTLTLTRTLLTTWKQLVISPTSPLQNFLKPLLKINSQLENVENEFKATEGTIRYHDSEIKKLEEEKRNLLQEKQKVEQILQKHPLQQELNELEESITAALKDNEMQRFFKLARHIIHAHLREIEYGRSKPTKFFKELQQWHGDDSVGFSEELIKHWKPLVEYLLMNAEESIKNMKWYDEEFQGSLKHFQQYLTESEDAARFLKLQGELRKRMELKESLEQLTEVKHLQSILDRLSRIERDINRNIEKKQALTKKREQLIQEREQLFRQLNEALFQAT